MCAPERGGEERARERKRGWKRDWLGGRPFRGWCVVGAGQADRLSVANSSSGAGMGGSQTKDDKMLRSNAPLAINNVKVHVSRRPSRQPSS